MLPSIPSVSRSSVKKLNRRKIDPNVARLYDFLKKDPIRDRFSFMFCITIKMLTAIPRKTTKIEI